MIIEDTRLLRFQVRRVLEDNGYTNVVELNSAAPILQHPQAYLSDVNLIILDIGLPEVNGIDFAKQLKQMPEYSSIPIVFISVHKALATVQEAISAGADDYFTKPINYNQFMYRINRLLGTDDEIESRNKKIEKIESVITNEYERARRGNTSLSFLVYKTSPEVFKKSQSILRENLRKIDSVLLVDDSILVILPLTAKDNLPIVINKIKEVSETGSLALKLTKSFYYNPSSDMRLDDINKEIFT